MYIYLPVRRRTNCETLVLSHHATHRPPLLDCLFFLVIDVGPFVFTLLQRSGTSEGFSSAFAGAGSPRRGRGASAGGLAAKDRSRAGGVEGHHELQPGRGGGFCGTGGVPSCVRVCIRAANLTCLLTVLSPSPWPTATKELPP